MSQLTKERVKDMKRFLAVLLSATLMLGLVACGGEEKKDEGKAGDANGAKTEGFVYDANGVAVAMDASAEEIVTSLGEPISYFESASCAFEGLDKTYTYDGFTLNTYPDKDGKDMVSSVVLNDDTVQTKEGAKLGMTSSEIEGLYGTDYTDSNGSYIYEKGGMKLMFVITDGAVTSIQYSTKVLD